MILAQNAISAHTSYDSNAASEVVFANDVQELLEMYLTQCETRFSKPGALMSRNEKVRALEFLDSRGIHDIQGGSQAVRIFQCFKVYSVYLS